MALIAVLSPMLIIIIMPIMKAKIIVTLYIKNVRLQGHFTQLIITKARCQCQ